MGNRMGTAAFAAHAFKQEHREQLFQQYRLRELEKQIAEAIEICMRLLPQSTSAAAFAKVKNEIDNSTAHLLNYVQSIDQQTTEKTILFQEMLGLSDETLNHMYALAASLFQAANFHDAHLIFQFLTLLAPDVLCYWISQGSCLHAKGLFQEALVSLEVAKSLNPHDPLPYTYIIPTLLLLNHENQAHEELDQLKEIISALPSDETALWSEKIAHLTA